MGGKLNKKDIAENSIIKSLNEGKILLCDGAMATELQKRGLSSDTAPEQLNILNPDLVRSVHSDYFKAGSDIVQTNSFGANYPRFKLHGLEDKVKEICRKSAEIARSVCPAGKYVAGSIGPTGEILEPFGPLSHGKAFKYFCEQAEALAEGGADLIIIETMVSVDEAEIAINAAAEKTHLPIAATMTFEDSPAGIKTMWGVDIPGAVERLVNSGANIIGSNCGQGFELMMAIMAQMRECTKMPLIAQPNAGQPEINEGTAVYRREPEVFFAMAEKLLDLGINILGGCCGTSPEHIASFRKLIDNFVLKEKIIQ
jgi:5-methyltetrahydrofolate--homocysteine methyltransferase